MFNFKNRYNVILATTLICLGSQTAPAQTFSKTSRTQSISSTTARSRPVSTQVEDVNGDGRVDEADVNEIRAHWTPDGESMSKADAPYDVNGNGAVDWDDLIQALSAARFKPEDFNTDGRVDDADADEIRAHWTAAGESMSSADAAYDVNGDGTIDFDDLLQVLSEASPKPADFNSDGYVDGDDLATIYANWGPCANSADVNGDGRTDQADVQLIESHWTGDSQTMSRADAAYDVDGDGKVGFGDLLEAISGHCTGDIDNDGEVGFSDLLLALQSYGA